MLQRTLWLLPLLLTACGLFNSVDNGINNGVQGATATHLAVITVLQTPPIPGFSTLPQFSVASVFFGNRPTETTLQPVPVTGATVSITDSSNLSTQCTEAGMGIYLDASLDGGFAYDQEATYTFKIVNSSNNTYTATGVAPAQETVSQLQTTITVDAGIPIPVFTQITAGNGFTLTRSVTVPTGGQLDIAFVTVFGIDGTTLSTNYTWTNAPQQPLDFLNLITNDSQWRNPTVDIPGTAFPTAGFYVVLLTAVQKGSSSSDDLFSGSAVLLGSATVGVLQAQ